MPCSPQPNRKFVRAPTRIFVCDNPSGRAFERMGQIHMGRVNPFRALVAGLNADESLLLGEAVNTSRGPTACWSGTDGTLPQG